MVTIDFSVLSGLVPYLPLLLPVVVTCIAGILRQDGLPNRVNEGITITLVLVASVVSALYNHALTANAQLDLVVILGYSATIMRLPYMQSLQQYLQTNWLNVLLSSGQKATNQASRAAVPSVQQQQLQSQIVGYNSGVPVASIGVPVTPVPYTGQAYSALEQARQAAFSPMPQQPVQQPSGFTSLEIPTVTGIPTSQAPQ